MIKRNFTQRVSGFRQCTRISWKWGQWLLEPCFAPTEALRHSVLQGVPVLTAEAKVTHPDAVWLDVNFLAPQYHRKQPRRPQWTTPKLTVWDSNKSELCYQLLPWCRPIWGEVEGSLVRRQQTPNPSPPEAQSSACWERARKSHCPDHLWVWLTCLRPHWALVRDWQWHRPGTSTVLGEDRLLSLPWGSYREKLGTCAHIPWTTTLLSFPIRSLKACLNSPSNTCN